MLGSKFAGCKNSLLFDRTYLVEFWLIFCLWSLAGVYSLCFPWWFLIFWDLPTHLLSLGQLRLLIIWLFFLYKSKLQLNPIEKNKKTRQLKREEEISFCLQSTLLWKRVPSKSCLLMRTIRYRDSTNTVYMMVSCSCQMNRQLAFPKTNGDFDKANPTVPLLCQRSLFCLYCKLTTIFIA